MGGEEWGVGSGGRKVKSPLEWEEGVETRLFVEPHRGLLERRFSKSSGAVV